MRSAEDFDLDDLVSSDSDSIDRGALRHRSSPVYGIARRELRWFHVRMLGRVPVVGAAPPDAVAAASRIAGWLSEIRPSHRGAFVLRYDQRRWPVRLLRQFGGLTSTVVRFGAMRSARTANETLAEAERAVVEALLVDLAAARPSKDRATRKIVRGQPEERLRRLRLAALANVRRAEHAYVRVRGNGRCVVPSAKGGA